MCNFGFQSSGGGSGSGSGLRPPITGITLGAGVTTAVDTGQSTYIPKAVASVQDSSGNEYIREVFVNRYYLDGTYKIDIYNGGDELANLTIYYN